MSARDGYFKREADISERSQHMKDCLLIPMIDDGSGKFIMDQREVNERLEAVTGNSIYTAAGKGAATIQASHARALRGYCNLLRPDAFGRSVGGGA